MKITFLLCGKTNEAWISSGMNIYSKRIKNYILFEEKTLPDLKNCSKLSFSEIKHLEGEQILAFIQYSDYMILMDENGKQYSSTSFASQIQKYMNAGHKHIVFVIGGAFGVAEALRKRANIRISFGKLTYTHQMIRLLLVEQIYRAFKIIKNEPYHW